MAFKELLKRLSPVLRKIAHKLNYAVSFLDAEDLFQEAVIYLWQAFEDNKLSDKTDSFILQGCYFHLKNYLRKVKGRAILVSLEELLGQNTHEISQPAFATNCNTSLNELGSKMFFEDIGKNGLSMREQEVISLLGEGLTLRQIGERIGVSHVMVVKIKSGLRGKVGVLLDKK